jgi:Predicted metal-dependent hydrolases related to alanyl-tRNA synthetase HxxxH domain
MILQRHLYLSDTYLTRVVTTVKRVGKGARGPWVLLDDNIFHPQGGGQPNDRGTVDGIPAIPRREGGTDVVLELGCPEDRVPEPSTEVTAEVDAELRKRHAALHTAGHLVDALTRRRYGLRHAGNNHFPGQSRIECHLDGRDLDRDELAELLQKEIAEAIAARLAVTASGDAERRSIEIEGLGGDPCGGTHVRHLGLLRDVTVRSVKVKSGRLRIGYDAAHAEEPLD